MKHAILFLVSIFCFNSINASLPEPTLSATATKTEQQAILKKLGRRPDFLLPWRCESIRSVILERVQLSSDRKTLKLYCNVGLAQIAIRQELLDRWADAVREKLL